MRSNAGIDLFIISSSTQYDIELGIGGKTGISVKKDFDKIIKSLTLKDIILSPFPFKF